MKNYQTIKLSFDDTKKTVTRKGNRTIVRLNAYINIDSFLECVTGGLVKEDQDFIESLGFAPTRYGTVEFTARGETTLQEGDTDDPDMAVRLASTKAKINAYRKFKQLLRHFADNFAKAYFSLESTYDNMDQFELDEKEALVRCRKTGYCDPSKG